jgi:predicted DNA-binding transcriptional regulator AlpA
MYKFYKTDFESLSEFLTIEEVADYLHISKYTLRNKIYKCDDLPENFRIGRRRLFPKKEFQMWVREKRLDQS